LRWPRARARGHRLDLVRRHERRGVPSRDRRARDRAGRGVLEPLAQCERVRPPARREGAAPATCAPPHRRVAMTESIAPPAPPAEAGAPAPSAKAAAERAPLKIGIVSPYGYPHPGGVNE